MKKLLIIPLLLLSLISSATVYYIDPGGKNTNSGTAGSPWGTLSYACSKVTSSGDIIHVNAGTYTETTQSVLAIGVSIEGEGVSSVIHSRVAGTSFTIKLESSSQNANGNQHISNIKMDGDNLTAYGAISVRYRGNVEIHHCTFVNFNYYGVSFINGEPPVTYATNNKFHDNIVTNCSGYYSGNRGDLEIGGQDGMLIYNNTMTVDRNGNDSGDVIYAVEGFLKNVKIYNNVLSKTYIPGTSHWDFSIEFWNCQGGVEIYNNDITGSIDIVKSPDKGTSAYNVWIHNNTIGQPSLKSAQAVRGVLLEYSCSDIIIEKNLIKNVAQGVYLQQAGAVQTVQNIDISYNIFHNIGANVNSTGWGIYWSIEERTDIAKNINIYNNVFSAQTGSYSTMYGIGLPDVGTASNVSVRNNTIINFDNSPVYASGTGSTSISTLSVENNIFYGNGNGNVPRYINGISITGNSTQNNIIGNPLFVSTADYHVQSGSPAIGGGLSIPKLTSDFSGNAINNPPSIGAYESLSAIPVSTAPVYQSSTVENASPANLVLTYSLSLANIVPPATAFIVQVNSVPRGINGITVSGSKVQMILTSPVIKGDIVKVAYNTPATNKLQTVSGGLAASFTAQTAKNNVTTVAPVASASKIVMTITPNPIHRILNAILTYVTPLTGDQASSLQVIRVSDMSGKLLIEKLLNKNSSGIRIPLNLRPGIYVVQLLISGLEMTSQKIIVY